MSTSDSDFEDIELGWTTPLIAANRGEDQTLLLEEEIKKPCHWNFKASMCGLIVVALVVVALARDINDSKSINKAKGLEQETTGRMYNPNGQLLHNFNAFEGDIITTPGQLAGAYGNDVAAAHFGIAVDNIEPDSVKRWPNGVVYYEFMPSVTNPNIKIMVDEAIAHVEANVPGIKIKKRTTEHDRIQIHQDNGACRAQQGCVGGPQPMYINPVMCANYTVVHEFMHALGFWHEQSRPDRNSFVTIHPENMKTNTLRWFRKRSSEATKLSMLPYDYDSLMHYHGETFSKNGKPTITAVRAATRYAGNPEKMGRQKFLSRQDIARLRDAYPETMEKSKTSMAKEIRS